MIGWLQGRLAERWEQGSRFTLLLVCAGVGYELQVSRRHWDGLPGSGQELTLHVHQAIREDSWTLYGFTSRGERDLFRELVGVSGVGPQMALGLLGELEQGELVRAIIEADLRLLCRAPGVGKRTAERLSVELRGRLQDRLAGDAGTSALTEADLLVGGDADGEALPRTLREELHHTLSALGYEALEINRALRAVAARPEPPGADGEAWLRESLRWLSRREAA
ncbi:MAG: Holliday junction branch migration protein RuvA [Cyanobacteriota bacterium]|jgi:Holliday junction DNA helicase RuvA